MEDTILYSSCWDANGGLFETILGAEDAIISDELNHASIIDGVRLCKAKRLRYKNNDMGDLEAKLKEAAGTRYKMIATDGVFSMDGTIADLEGGLRPRRQVRRLGDGRRLARRRVHGQKRAGYTRVPRRDGPGRYLDRHAGQGLGRRQRRLHEQPVGDHHDAPPAVAALSFLELGRSIDRRSLDSRRSRSAAVRPNCATGSRRTPSSSARR